MAEEKKSIEIECPECKTRFRLWVPERLLFKWRNGGEIGCVQCRTRIKLEKDGDGFRIGRPQPVREIITQAREIITGLIPEETPAAPKAGGEIILVVDDDAGIRKKAEDTLIKNGFTPLTAKNGNEALELIRQDQISLVAVDLHLKNPQDPASTMDGEDFLQGLLATGKKIPAIVTTAKDVIDDIIYDHKWYDLHVEAFVQKGSPFWTDDFIIKIKEILKKD